MDVTLMFSLSFKLIVSRMKGWFSGSRPRRRGVVRRLPLWPSLSPNETKVSESSDWPCPAKEVGRKPSPLVTVMERPAGFFLLVDQEPGLGEDAEPILASDEDYGVLGVFDGLGGAGATVVADGGHTHAFVASRLAQHVVARYYHEVWRAAPTFEGLARRLSDQLQRAFSQEADRIGETSSRLSSRLIKRLPTTMASIYFKLVDDRCEGVSLWAGDSRSYVLDPGNGLSQVTEDDIRGEGDALQVSLTDSVLSYFLSAEEPIELRSLRFGTMLPTVLVVATDGAFDYLPTPMHFEHLLISQLLKAECMEGWRASLMEVLAQVAGDDVSLVIQPLGWQSFAELQAGFVQRGGELGKRVKRLDTIRLRLRKAREEQVRLARQEPAELQTAWLWYKPQYEQFLPGKGET